MYQMTSVWLVSLALLSLLPLQQRTGLPQKYALLVGCSVYPNNSTLRDLYGPLNDIRLWESELTNPQGLAFPRANVQTLVGWPNGKEYRPTYQNIVNGFQTLIDKAQPGAQIVIVLAGHGVQVPIPESQKDPLDPRNPEPDGLDEVFLPADVGAWTGNELKNALKDDQLGEWLGKMRDKGAHVLIVFDCCHAGTMTRGGSSLPDDTVEISRVADPLKLGVTQKQIDLAVQRACAALKSAEKSGKKLDESALQVPPAHKATKGSLVAFYAAQSFEVAPELPLPDGAPLAKEHYYGLLSYTMVQCLRQRGSPISYGDLNRMIGARYRAMRGSRTPTPFAEGDLNREVLGLTVWPNRPALVLQKENAKLRLHAGELHGLTKDSILAVHPPAGDKREPRTVLGYLRVEQVTATTATVKPAAFDMKDVVAATDLPELARCEVVRRAFGEMRVLVHRSPSAMLEKAIAQLDPQAKDMIREANKESEAEWLLRPVSVATAKQEFGLNLKGDSVLLLPGTGRKRLAEEEQALGKHFQAIGRARPRQVFGVYPQEDAVRLSKELERDLPRLFQWQNLWRIASGIAALDGGETHGLKFEVAQLKDENDRSGGELFRGGALRSGQEMEFRLKNEGLEDLWVSVLYLDSNCGVQHYLTTSIKKGSSLRPIRTVMDAKSGSGLEGMLVLAVPMTVQREEPRYAFLEQEGLQVLTRTGAGRLRGSQFAPENPFGRLLSAAAFNKGTREMLPRVPTTPAILTQSWVLLPER